MCREACDDDDDDDDGSSYREEKEPILSSNTKKEMDPTIFFLPFTLGITRLRNRSRSGSVGQLWLSSITSLLPPQWLQIPSSSSSSLLLLLLPLLLLLLRLFLLLVLLDLTNQREGRLG